MYKLLQLKSWQLFLLLFGFPFVIQIISLVLIFSTRNVSAALIGFLLVMIIFMGTFFGWIYALGSNLLPKLPDTVNMSFTKFKIFLLLPLLYILLIFIFVFVNIGTHNPGDKVEPTSGVGVAALIVPVHLFSMFCIFYCIYFISKALKAVELQRPVTSGDYIGEFFLFWFFPIGVWILQPRINRVFAENIEVQ